MNKKDKEQNKEKRKEELKTWYKKWYIWLAIIFIILVSSGVLS